MVNSQGAIDGRLLAIRAMPKAARGAIVGIQLLAQVLVSTPTAVRDE